MPRSLNEALENLEEDHDFLLKGDVFTQDCIEAWVDYERGSGDSDPWGVDGSP